jgi:hypothetical protein
MIDIINSIDDNYNNNLLNNRDRLPSPSLNLSQQQKCLSL